jgi:hypothetical protein
MPPGEFSGQLSVPEGEGDYPYIQRRNYFRRAMLGLTITIPNWIIFYAFVIIGTATLVVIVFNILEALGQAITRHLNSKR